MQPYLPPYIYIRIKIPVDKLQLKIFKNIFKTIDNHGNKQSSNHSQITS